MKMKFCYQNGDTYKVFDKADLCVLVFDHVLHGQEAAVVCPDGDPAREHQRLHRRLQQRQLVSENRY